MRATKKDGAENRPRLCLVIMPVEWYTSNAAPSGQGLAASDAHLVVAGAAIHGAIIPGQEWHLCFSAALGTDDRVHFTWGALSRTPAHAAGGVPARCAAGGATTGLIHQPFLLVKFLFAGCEDEVVSTIAAF